MMVKMQQLRSLIKPVFVSVLLLGSIFFLMPSAVEAQGSEAACTAIGGSWGGGECQTDGTDELTSLPQTITDILLFLVGAISVIMLIVGGFKYVLSSGDANKAESAKNTIMYAIVGIVVAFLAWAIVDFVIERLLD